MLRPLLLNLQALRHKMVNVNITVQDKTNIAAKMRDIIEGAKIGISKLDKFYRDVDLTLMDNNGKPIYDAKKLKDNLTGLGSMIKDIKVLEEEVKKEIDAKSSRKGGKQKSIFEGGIK